MDLYCRYSPPLASLISRHEALRSATRWALTPLVLGVAYPFRFGLTRSVWPVSRQGGDGSSWTRPSRLGRPGRRVAVKDDEPLAG